MGRLTQLYVESRKKLQGRDNRYDALVATVADPHQPTVFRRPGQVPARYSTTPATVSVAEPCASPARPSVCPL